MSTSSKTPPVRTATPRGPHLTPPLRPKETQAVRACVSSWAGRSLNVQPLGDLQRAASVLSQHEAALSTHSPHAPRLLENLRNELDRRAQQ